MRPTRVGVAAALLAGFTLFAAGSTTNNLLYMLFSSVVSGFSVALALGWWNLRGLSLRIVTPAQVFRGAPFSAEVVVENRQSIPARSVRIVGPLGVSDPFDVPAGGKTKIPLRLILPQRGWNSLRSVRLESAHPFGFFLVRKTVSPVDVLALPQAGALHSTHALESDSRVAGSGARGKSREGDFFGPRPHTVDDDARLIHWKLSAKTGGLVVAEFSAAPEGRVTVRLDETDDASVEKAAAACRSYIDSGFETGLAGPGVEVAPGRGPAQFQKILRALAETGPGARSRPTPGPVDNGDEGPIDSQVLRRLTLFGGVLVYASMFLIEELNARAMLAFAPFIPIGIWLHEREGPFLPRWIWNVASSVILIFLVIFDWRISGVALANAHLIGYLLFNRLLNPWPRTELRQALLISFLAFFLISGLTVSPWYFPLFIAYIGFAAAWLALQSGSDLRRFKNWVPERILILGLGGLIGAGIFIVVPRVEGLRRFNPFVASGLDKLQIRSESVAGFTDQVTLGRFGALRRSSARAMRVRPAAGPGVPGAQSLYMRGAAFDSFDGLTWTKSRLDFRYRAANGRIVATSAGRAEGVHQGFSTTFPSPSGSLSFVDVELYPMQVSVVFTPGTPRLIEGISTPLLFDHTDSVITSENFGGGGRYRVYLSLPGAQPTDAAIDLQARALERASQLPYDGSGQIAALAATWTGPARGVPQKIAAIIAHLNREYTYSLRFDDKRAGLADFLFRVRKGNCEYFATAAAVLLRSVGVPTRLVTGFRTDEWNAWGRFYDVRQSNAHAWVEAWDPDRGWVTIDPTPGESEFSSAADALSRRLQRWADDFQGRWYRLIVGYDQYTQRDTFFRLRGALALNRMQTLIVGALKKLILVVVMAWLTWRGWLTATLFFRRADEYERAERALAGAGFIRNQNQTAREFVMQVCQERPDLAELNDLVDVHYRRRWGLAQPNSDDDRRAVEILKKVRSKLKTVPVKR